MAHRHYALDGPPVESVVHQVAVPASSSVLVLPPPRCIQYQAAVMRHLYQAADITYSPPVDTAARWIQPPVDTAARCVKYGA